MLWKIIEETDFSILLICEYLGNTKYSIVKSEQNKMEMNANYNGDFCQ